MNSVIDNQIEFQNKQAAVSVIDLNTLKALEKSRTVLYACLGATSPADKLIRSEINAAITAIEAVY
jgi:hypothetical protein